MVFAPVRRDNPRALARGLSTVQAHKTMFYLTCTTITDVDLAHYGVAGWGCLDIFTLIYPFSSLSLSLWETARYRLK